MFKKLLCKYVFCDTDKGGLTSLPCPLYFPGMEKERWNNSKIQFKVNTEGSWKNTEVWRHLTFFSSSEYLCASISPLACGGYDISIVGSSEMPLDGKLYQNNRDAQAFLITFLSTYLRNNFLEILIKAGIAQCLHPEAKRELSYPIS